MNLFPSLSRRTWLLALTLPLLAVPMSPVLAGDSIILSVPFPGTGGGVIPIEGGTAPISLRIAQSYLSPLIRVVMSVTTALCVFYVVLGGYEIMVAGSITGNQAGKEKIYKALLGLALIFSSALILNIMNPSVFSL